MGGIHNKEYLVTTIQKKKSDSDLPKIETVAFIFFSLKLISPNALVTAVIFVSLCFTALFSFKYLLPTPNLKLTRDRGLASTSEALLGFVDL